MAKSSVLSKITGNVAPITTPQAPPTGQVLPDLTATVKAPVPNKAGQLAENVRIGYARQIADKLAQDKELSAELMRTAEAGVDNARGPCAVAIRMGGLEWPRVQDGGDLTSDELLGMPRKGTEEKDVAGTNAISDKYKTQVRKADGTLGDGEGSYYKDIANSHPMAIEALQVMKDLEKANQEPPSGPYANATVTWRVGEKGMQNARYQSVVNTIGNAHSVLMQMYAIKEKMPMVSVSFVRDLQANTLARVQKCIQVQENNNASMFAAFTWAQFVRLKVDVAAANGGTVAALRATGKKKKGPPDTGPTAPGAPISRTTEQFMGTMSIVSLELSDADFKAALIKRLNSRKPQDRNELLTNLCDVYVELKQICEPLIPEYMELTTPKKPEQRAADAAKTA